MSETSPVTHIPAQGRNIPGCIGTPLPNTSAKIVSTETGADLPPGPEGVGELCIQGPQVMQGYLNNASATANTIKGGWLHTGT
jgi:long-subunit acyl-CoA synthetase (AMP-forming)